MPTHPVKAHVQKRMAQHIAPLKALAAESKAKRDARKLKEFYDYLDTLDDQDDQDASGWLAELDAESNRLRRRVDLVKPYEDEVAAVLRGPREDRACNMRADHKVYHPPTPPVPSSKASMTSGRSSRGSSAANSRVLSFSGDSGYFSHASAVSPGPVATVRIDERPPPRDAQRPRPQPRSGSSQSSALFMSNRSVSSSASSARVTGGARWDSDQQRILNFLADDNEKARLEAWVGKVERDGQRRGPKG